ncbi:MAG: SpoIIE family protein phosphatase [Chloracidobacterium sp.]
MIWLWLGWLSSQGSVFALESFSPEHLARSLRLEQPISLDGRWRFQTGDDLRWAMSSWDDIAWPQISVAQSWGKQGYRGYAGVAWYRRTVPLPPAAPGSGTGLGLALAGVDWASYEVFVNGHLVGRFGRWAATDAFAIPHPQYFFVPAEVIVPDQPLVIAIRFWQLPASMRRTPQGGGFEGGLFLLGNATQVGQAVHLAIAERKQAQVGDLVLALVFLLAGFFHLLFFLRRRSQREYFWFGLFAILFGLNWYGAGARWWASEWIDYVTLWRLNSFTIAIFLVPQACFLWTLFGRKMGWFVKAYLWLLTLSAITVVIIPGVTFSLLTSTPRVLLALLFPLLSVILVVVEARRGNPEARTIGIGLLISVACSLNDILGVRLGLYATVSLAHVGLGAILLSMALSLANRFARVYGELDALNHNLEDKVRQRTAVIAQQRDALEQKQVELTASLTYAQRIQQALLPGADDLARIGGCGAFVFFLPRDIVSGDFYWIHHTAHGVYVGVGDCTGHGVPGAFMALIGIDLLNRLVVDTPAPGLLLERLDLAVRRALRQEQNSPAATDDGMEVALCYIEHGTARLIFAGARRPLYVVPMDGALQEIKGTRRSIGGDRRGQRRAFLEWSAQLSTIRAFYLASDGFTDQNGVLASRNFGTNRFRALLERLAALPPAVQQAELVQTFEQYRQEAAQRDDVTVLGVQWQA